MKTRRIPTKHLYCFTLILVFALTQSVCWGQAIDFFSSLGNKSKRPKDAVTTIEADTMDIEINNNRAVFNGSVVIDDHEIRIDCDKMIIFLLDDKKEKGGKRMQKIECIGNVIMTRKLYDQQDKEQGEQKAKAGKVIYNVETGDITLLDKPVLIRGVDSIAGEVITFNRETHALKVDPGKRKKGRAKIVIKSGGISVSEDEKKENDK